MSEIEIIGGPEDSSFSKAELGTFAPKEGDNGAPPAPTQAGEQLTSASPAWMWAEGVQGKGEKPEYLMDKYTSVAEQARALPEALKRFGAFKGAPKDGYDMSKLPEGMSAESPVLKAFLEPFKEMNLDQAGFEKLAGTFASLHQEMGSKSQQEILQEVGSQEVIDRVNNWVKSLPAEIQDTVKEWQLSGADFKALDAIRSGRAPSALPSPAQYESRHSYETKKGVEAEKNANFKRYQEDEAYRSEIERRWSEADARAKAMNGSLR